MAKGSGWDSESVESLFPELQLPCFNYCDSRFWWLGIHSWKPKNVYWCYLKTSDSIDK